MVVPWEEILEAQRGQGDQDAVGPAAWKERAEGSRAEEWEWLESEVECRWGRDSWLGEQRYSSDVGALKLGACDSLSI